MQTGNLIALIPEIAFFLGIFFVLFAVIYAMLGQLIVKGFESYWQIQLDWPWWVTNVLWPHQLWLMYIDQRDRVQQGDIPF